MGNRGRARQGAAGTEKRAAGAVSAPGRELPRHRPASTAAPAHRGPRAADLDACIQELVDAAPPLTGEQRDTLALLLRRPPRR